MLKKYQILIHLYNHRNDWMEYNDFLFARKSITQKGIASAVGIQRNNVGRYIRELERENLIEKRKARIIDGERRKIFAYRPTQRGEMKAVELERMWMDWQRRERARV